MLRKLEFSGIAFADVVQFLRDVSGCNIHVHWPVLVGVSVDPGTPVNVSLSNVTLGKALEYVLRDVGAVTPLAAVLDKGVIRITTMEDAHAGCANAMILETAPESGLAGSPPVPGKPVADLATPKYRSWSELLADVDRERRKGNLDPGLLGAAGYREANADELASVLEALVVEAQKVWSEHVSLWQISEPRTLSKREDEATDGNYGFPAVRMLDGSCWRAVRCTLEAERWLHREVGPVAAEQLLDDIAAGIQIAQRVVGEIEETAEVRSLHYVESIRDGHVKRYKTVWTGTQHERTPPMSAEEIIAEQVRSCAEFDGSLLDGLDGFHRTIQRLREVALGSGSRASGELKSRSKATGRKRGPGRPRVSAKEAKRRGEILAAWKKARHAAVSRQDFCRDWGEMHPDEEPLTVKDLETFADWARQREIREDEPK